MKPNSSKVFAYCVGEIYFSHLSEYIERTCGQKNQQHIRKISHKFETKSKFCFYERKLNSALKCWRPVNAQFCHRSSFQAIILFANYSITSKIKLIEGISTYSIYFFNPRFQWKLFTNSVQLNKSKFDRIGHLHLDIKYSITQKQQTKLFMFFRLLSILGLYFFRVWQSFLITWVY